MSARNACKRNGQKHSRSSYLPHHRHPKEDLGKVYVRLEGSREISPSFCPSGRLRTYTKAREKKTLVQHESQSHMGTTLTSRGFGNRSTNWSSTSSFEYTELAESRLLCKGSSRPPSSEDPPSRLGLLGGIGGAKTTAGSSVLGVGGMDMPAAANRGSKLPALSLGICPPVPRPIVAELWLPF